MNVPGLTGTWQQRNAQYYKALGSPMGKYTGSLQQNLYLLDQIKKQNFPQAQAPAPTPQPAVPVSQQYTQAGVEQVNRAAEIPQFEDAMGTFKQLWESRFRDPINTAAQYQVRPEFTRAYNEANYDYMNQMGSAGGQRLGRGRMGLGNLKAASNRAYLATLGDWVDQQRQNLYSKWYEPTAEDWNTAKLQANFNKDDYAIPTWEEGLEKYGSAFGAGITPGLFS
jgi:hypothetical protein